MGLDPVSVGALVVVLAALSSRVSIPTRHGLLTIAGGAPALVHELTRLVEALPKSIWTRLG